VHGVDGIRQGVTGPSLIIERCFADVVAVVIVAVVVVFGVHEVAVVVRPYCHRVRVREPQMIEILRSADIRNVR